MISPKAGAGVDYEQRCCTDWRWMRNSPFPKAVASGDAFEHRPSECGHCVQHFLAESDLRDLPGELGGLESGADDALPAADLRCHPATSIVPCCRLPGHAAVAADLGNMAIPNGRITAFFGGGITTSKVSPYRCLSDRAEILYQVK